MTRTRRSSSSPPTRTKRKRTTRTESAAPARVAIALGANLGAPRRQLLAAVAALSRSLGALAVAPLFRSPAVSPIPQPDYLNSVVVARTALRPGELLALLKTLEREAGREPGPRWGPRPLDLDLLLVGDRIVDAPELVVPHPRLAERAFVLAPLAALLPDVVVPGHGCTVAALLRALPGGAGLVRVPWNEPATAAGAA